MVVYMIIVGLLMAIITLYNYFTAPRTETSIAATQIVKAQKRIFSSFLVSSKETNRFSTCFYLTFRLGNHST
jgi:hypothetical protein